MTMTEEQQDLAAAKQRIVGDVPVIPDSPDTSVSLAVGAQIGNSVVTTAQVKELTGADEERLAKAKSEQEFFSMVVALGTVRLGDQEMEDQPLAMRRSMLGQLLSGDRDVLFLAIVKATFGDERHVGFTCSACGEEQEATLLLSEDFPQSEGDPAPVHTFTTSRGDVIEYRLVRGSDQDELAEKPLSTAEMNTLLLSRCITRVNGDLVVDPLAYAKNLGMRDRRALLDEMMAKQPSVDMTLSVPCVACGEEVPLNVGWGTLFRTG